jgi:hypothetical protein
MSKLFLRRVVCLAGIVGIGSAVADGSVISPVSSGLIVGLDGSNVLVDGSNKLKVWYDQIGAAQADYQDYGVQTGSLQPTLLNAAPMPNGSLHNIVDFLGNAGGTTGSRLESARNNGSDLRVLNFSDTFTGGADAAYSNQAAVTWFLVIRPDSLPASASRTLFSSDHATPSSAVDLQSNLNNSSSTNKIRNLGRFANNENATVNNFDGTLNPSWYIAAVQYNQNSSAVNGVAATSMRVSVLRQDGTADVFSASPATLGTAAGMLGTHVLSTLGGITSSTTGNLFDGKFAEFMYYNTALSDADTASVVSYLNDKYFIPEPSTLFLTVVGIGVIVFVTKGRRQTLLRFA